MAFEIPAQFLNVRIYAWINVSLAVLCMIFQIGSLATSPHNYYEIMGSGLWGGLILAITALVSFRVNSGDQPFVLGCSFVLAIIAVITSFIIMCICSSSLDAMHRYPAACVDYVTVNLNSTCTAENNPVDYHIHVPIPPCGDYSLTRQSFNALLLVCGLFGIPVNSLLVLGIISQFNPTI